MKQRQRRPLPPKFVRLSTVRADRLTRGRKPPRPRPRAATPKPALRPPKTPTRPRRVGHLVDEEHASVLDLIDNLLSKGVMLNADLILALADVDLIYLRLSALLCAADRVMSRRAGAKGRAASEPRARSAPAQRRARARVGESVGRSPSELEDGLVCVRARRRAP
jgi:hypothetical protein